MKKFVASQKDEDAYHKTCSTEFELDIVFDFSIGLKTDLMVVSTHKKTPTSLLVVSYGPAEDI